MRKTIRAAIGAAAICVTAQCFAAGALQVAREIVVDSNPTTVWKLVGHFNSLDVWHPAVTNSAMTGSGTTTADGSWRLLTLGNGATVTEPLVAYSAEKFSYSYEITKSPLPIKNYVATISLSPVPGGKTLMKWGANFDANGASDKEAMDTMAGVYEAGLNKVASIFKRQ